MGLILRGGPAPRRRARSLEAGLLRLRAAHARAHPHADCFSGLTIFLAFAVNWWSWRGPRPAWLCGPFSGWLKPGSQSSTHTARVAWRAARGASAGPTPTRTWQTTPTSMAKLRRCSHGAGLPLYVTAAARAPARPAVAAPAATAAQRE